MLDLNAIAARRAAALGQTDERWRAAVWGAGFQGLSTNLTDGEVEELLELCGSADELETLTLVLGRLTAGADVTPLEWLKREAGAVGLSPGDWVRTKARP